MARYRELAGGRTFRCAGCGRRKKVEYVPSSNLCRDCAAKRRCRTPNVPVTLADGLVVTTAVEKRLRKQAARDVHKNRVFKIGESISRFIFLAMWASAPFVTMSLFDDFSGLMWLFVLGWAFLIPYAVMDVTDRVLAKPRQEREQQVSDRVRLLAEERHERLKERERFYSSPEWTMIREQVIGEEGRVCSECGQRIRREGDVTVDHKRPRSKFPELALTRENLQVLCRRCNSRKGAGDWLEA